MLTESYREYNFEYSFYSIKINGLLYHFDVIECLTARGQDIKARFTAIFHRGYPSRFNLNLIGQAATMAAAVAIAQHKLVGLSAEQVQETPGGRWTAACPRQLYHASAYAA